jgi:hypothetical protein
MSDEAEIRVLRLTARTSLREYRDLLAGYDCAPSKLKNISPRAARAVARYNASMTRLREIDPDCPEVTPL